MRNVSTVKAASSASAADSSAILSGELDRERADLTTAQSALQKLEDAEKELLVSATDEAIRAHDEEMAACRLRVRRISARIDNLSSRIEQAMAREIEEKKITAANDAKAKCAAYQRFLAEYEGLAEKLMTGLQLGHDAYQAVVAVNKNLPTGWQDLSNPEVEIRHRPGTPDRTEKVQVQRRRETPGSAVRVGVGQSLPMETVTEDRVIYGTSPFRPPALWEEIELPGLRPGDAPYRVPGTRRR
jgi:chromosome segregation ATPase